MTKRIRKIGNKMLDAHTGGEAFLPSNCPSHFESGESMSFARQDCLRECKLDDLLAVARTRGLALYGTGYVAEMLFQGLNNQGIWPCVRVCLITDEAKAGQQFHGIPVRSVASWAADRTDNPLVCLAAHEAIASEMARHARECGITDVAWVYPSIHELLFGPPLQQVAELSVTSLLAEQPKNWYWIAARACALTQVEEGSPIYSSIGTSVYTKCMALHCSKETAQKRLEEFRKLDTSMKENGYDASQPVLIDEQLRIIDGLHRVALAWWLGNETLPATIFAASDMYDRSFGDNNKLTPDALFQAGLTQEEHALLNRMQASILNGETALCTTGSDAFSNMPAQACDAPEISIIAPVYNVAEYIDDCLRTVVEQTFSDFEVLLIDDGSTDESGTKCDAWARQDARIRVIHQRNCGVSAARNRGIEEARGTYLAFVDPDDWLDLQYLEKLHERAVLTGADFVECDLWRYNGRNGTKIWRHCGQRMGVPYTNAEHMKYGPTASYKAISRRDLWMKNNVRFPSCAFESPAIYALVLALANHVEYLPEPLYYYRRFRENSLIETGYAHRDGSANNTLGIEAMEYLINQFAEHNLLRQYADDLPGIVLWRLNDILAMQYHRKSESDFAEMVSNYRAFVDQALPQVENLPYIVWGGYNLNKICQHMNMLHDPSCRFNFSSLISIAKPSNARFDVHHSNRYRQMMVQREIEQKFWDVIRDQQPAFIVMDLLEERFDLLEWQNRYLTKSDAWAGVETEGMHGNRVIPRESEECLHLFENCLQVISKRLSADYPQTNIVVVENYLAEEVGDLDCRQAFPEIEQIRSTNELLERLYDIACATLPNVTRIPADRQEWYFTDSHYEYGAVPQHLNAIVNQRIGKLIERAMQGEHAATLGER